MSEALFSSNSYQAAKVLLDAAATRHGALASNLANSETKGYRRVDLRPDFVAELRKAVGSGDSNAIRNLQPRITVDERARSLNANGNNVSVERELMEINRNAVEFETFAELVSGSLKHLKTAITGRTQ